MQTSVIPKRLQSVLWSYDVDKLDLNRDRAYIIHQVLIHGSLADFNWLLSIYSRKEIIDVFLHSPYKNYPKYMYYFVKNYLLELKKVSLDEDDYVTSIHGSVRPRATGSI